jgi:hypothetical protein
MVRSAPWAAAVASKDSATRRRVTYFMVVRIQMGYSIMRRRFILPGGGLGYGIGVKSPFASSGGFPVRCFSSNWLGVRPSSRALFSNRSKSSRENLSIVDRDRENFGNSELAGLFFRRLGDARLSPRGRGRSSIKSRTVNRCSESGSESATTARGAIRHPTTSIWTDVKSLIVSTVA